MVKKSRSSTVLAPELDALDRGEYVAAAARFDEGDVPRGESAALWCADVAIYLGRLENVEHYLSMAPECELRTVLEAERLFATNAWSEADAMLVGLTSARAIVNRARVAFKTGEWDRCLELARDVEHQAEREGNEFLAGRARYLGAVALDEAGHRNAAEDMMRSAVRALRETERGRYLAFALNHQAWLVVERLPDQARELVAEARTIAAGLGQSADLIVYDTALIQHVHRAGRYREVIERARPFVDLVAELGDPDHECYARTMWCVAALAIGDVASARSALAGLPFAALPGSDTTRVKAEMLVDRVAAHGYELGAPKRIEAKLAEPGRFKAAWQTSLAKLWLWDALAVVDPWQARARHAELTTDAKNDKDWFVQAEVRAVARTPRTTRWTGAGWLFVAEALPDGVRAQDALDANYEAVRHQLFENAHRAAGGVQGAIVGATSWSGGHVSKLRERYGYPAPSPGRPAKSAADDGSYPSDDVLKGRKQR